ncbi:hypothetical protein [Calditerricola yamamurae]
MSSPPKAVTIPANRGKKRSGTAPLPVTLNTKHLVPGFYSSVIRLDDGDGVTDLEIPVSVVVPVLLDVQTRDTYSDEASVPTAKYTRYFFRMPHGVEKAVITLQVARHAAGRPPWTLEAHGVYAGRPAVSRRALCGP